MSYDPSDHHVKEFHVYYDCMFAGEVAQGHWRMQAHAPLQAATRALVHWLASLPEVRLSWEHISAHTGHPWNEAADAAAWAAVSEWILPSDFALLENLLAADSTSIDWIWMLERSQQPIAPFPPVHDGLIRLNASAVLDHVPSAGKHPFH